MSTFVFILLVLFGLSLLCALLIISAAIMSSRSSQRLIAKGLIDLTEEKPLTEEIPPKMNKAPRKQQSTHMVIR